MKIEERIALNILFLAVTLMIGFQIGRSFGFNETTKIIEGICRYASK